MLKYNPKLRKLARYFRKNQTKAEEILWQKLRKRQIINVQFYRQRPIDEYIVDFCCLKPIKLIIEIDGDSHYKVGANKKDKIREEKLKGKGFKILRFTNGDIYENLEGVLEKTFDIIKSPLTPL
jgi:very-short-patch-repair endonuclease